jgi:hypothetical protein
MVLGAVPMLKPFAGVIIVFSCSLNKDEINAQQRAKRQKVLTRP